MQLIETPAGAALASITEQPVLDPVKRAEHRQKARVNTRHSARLKPAAREVKPASGKKNKAKPAKKDSVSTSQLIAAADALGLTVKKWADERMALVKVPSFSDFLATLPKKDEKDCSAEIRLFRSVVRGIAMLKPEANRPAVFVIAKSGYVGIHTYL